MPTTIGLDLAKPISWYAAIDENDNLLADGKIPSTRKPLASIVERFNPELVLVEASSITASAVDALVDLGVPVWPVHPASLPTRRQRRKKTDKVDAIQLVRLYRGGVLTKAWLPNKELRATAERLRGIVQDTIPDAVETVSGGAKMAMALYSIDDPNDVVCGIQPSQDMCKLFFHGWPQLRDAGYRLEGSGKHARHVKMRSVRGFGADKIADMLSIAYKAR